MPQAGSNLLPMSANDRLCMQLTYHEWNPTVIVKAIALQIGPLTEQSRPFLLY
jgi:hypothetical protein